MTTEKFLRVFCAIVMFTFRYFILLFENAVREQKLCDFAVLTY